MRLPWDCSPVTQEPWELYQATFGHLTSVEQLKTRLIVKSRKRMFIQIGHFGKKSKEVQ